MSDQITLLEPEIATAIAKDVRRHKGCTKFKGVTLHRLMDGLIASNWSVGTVNYGGADQRACDDALREVIPRMQRHYRLP